MHPCTIVNKIFRRTNQRRSVKMMGRRGAKKFTMFELVSVVLTVMILDLGAPSAQEDSSAMACKAERRAGINACKPVLYGMSPSAQCCDRIRVTHLECVCPIITPKLAALINVNQLVSLVEGCGRRVPHHFKCGSIATP